MQIFKAKYSFFLLFLPFIFLFAQDSSYSAQDSLEETNHTSSPNFFGLPITKEEKKTIAKIIQTMASKNEIMLLFEKRSLERKGKMIENVHPLRFLEVIFSDEELKSCLRSIQKSHFKWGHFIDGLARRLEEEAEKGNLFPYLNAFCQSIRANNEAVLHLAKKKDWEALVVYLL
jgi:hypothetical protein